MLRRETRSPRLAAALATVGLVASGIFASARPPVAASSTLDDASSYHQGEHLYNGELPLEAYIDGNSAALSVKAVRCANCHQRSESATRQPAGPPLLNRQALLASDRRRGGPAFSYKLDTFCRTVRTGVDPAYTVLQKIMPRYRLSDRDCASLWTYITAPAGQVVSNPKESAHDR